MRSLTVLRLYPSILANDRVAKCDTYLPTGAVQINTFRYLYPQSALSIFMYRYYNEIDQCMAKIPTTFVLKDGINIQALEILWHLVRDHGRILVISFTARYHIFRLRLTGKEDLALVQAAYVVIRLPQTYSSLKSWDNKPFRERVTISLSS